LTYSSEVERPLTGLTLTLTLTLRLSLSLSLRLYLPVRCQCGHLRLLVQRQTRVHLLLLLLTDVHVEVPTGLTEHLRVESHRQAVIAQPEAWRAVVVSGIVDVVAVVVGSSELTGRKPIHLSQSLVVLFASPVRWMTMKIKSSEIMKETQTRIVRSSRLICTEVSHHDPEALTHRLLLVRSLRLAILPIIGVHPRQRTRCRVRKQRGLLLLLSVRLTFSHCAVQAFLDPYSLSRSRLLNGCDKVGTAMSNGVNQNARAKSGGGIDPSAALVL
jgi:hypothetical protein